MDNEATNTETRSNATSRLLIGPLTALAIALLLLVDVLGIFFGFGSSIKDDAVIFGLSSGQVGAVGVWVFSVKVRRRLRWVVLSYAVAAAAGVYSALYLGPQSSTYVALYVLLFVACNTLSLCLLYAHYWFWSPSRYDGDRQIPQYKVAHLLIAMFIIALLGLAARFALPDIGALASVEVLVVVAQFAGLTTVAAVLLLDRPPNLWRFGTLAATSFAAAFVTVSLIDWETAYYASAIQVAVLALAICVPQFDRYKLRVHFEPREPEQTQGELSD